MIPFIILTLFGVGVLFEVALEVLNYRFTKDSKVFRKSLIDHDIPLKIYSAFVGLVMIWFQLYAYSDLLIIGGVSLLLLLIQISMTSKSKRMLRNKLKDALLKVVVLSIILVASWYFFTILNQALLIIFTIALFILFIGLYSLFFERIITRVFKVTPYETLTETMFFNEPIYMVQMEKSHLPLNAMIIGAYKRKKIVLTHSLVGLLKYEELMGIIAHEKTHDDKHHLMTRLFLLIVSISLYFSVGFYVFNTLDHPSFETYFLFVLLLYTVFIPYRLCFITLIHKQEFEADRGTIAYNVVEGLIRGLKRIDQRQNMKPMHPFYALYHTTHPPTEIRVNRLRSSLNSTGDSN